MTTNAITNIHVDSFSFDGDKAAATWEQDGARFHVWFLTRTRSIDSPIIYKNPPLGTARGTPGHYDTRKLNAMHPKNAAILERVFETINREGLVAKGLKEKAAAERDEAERQKRLAIDARREEFARLLPEMWAHDREELLTQLSDTLSMSDIDELTARLP